MEISHNIVVLYHGNCPDGFGAAYAAWKKFGDTAEYIPLVDRINPPAGLAGKEVYLIDFSYPSEVLKKIEAEAKFFIVIDHHITAKECIESLKYHVYDVDHSGCYLAWKYFHPDTSVPLLMRYVEDGDLYRFALPSSRAVLAWFALQEMNFTRWDELASELEKPEVLKEYIVKGEGYREHWNHLVRAIIKDAEEVEFEGYHVMALNASRMFRSDAGHILAEQKPPFAIIWYYDPERGFICSLRGDGSIDVSKLAAKYGGGGHFSAASFRLEANLPMPWKSLQNS